MKKIPFKAAYVQTDPAFLRVEENLARAEALVRRVNADLIVLPELFSSGYHFRSKKDVKRIAEPLAGPTVARLKALAREKDCAFVAGFAERSGGRFFNSAVLATPRKAEVYRKVHLFGRERLFFAPGDLGFRVFEWKGARIGVMVCYDWFFPEAGRTLALKGADLIAHPANLVLPYCPEAMKTRCLENRVCAVTADRVGRERGLAFIGRSQVVDERGRVLKRASASREETGAVLLDLARARDKRLNRFNRLLSDRRPASYRARP